MRSNPAYADAARLNGAIKWFDPEKGYGFITPDAIDGYQRPKDIFLHISALKGAGLTAADAYEGRRIRFAVEERKPGKTSATLIEMID